MVKIVEFASQPKDTLPYDVVDDVQQYMKNDPMFYRKIYYPAMVRMQDAMKNNKEPKDLIAPMVGLATKGYVEAYKINKNPEDLLTTEDYDDIINRIYEDEIEALRKGEY